jgi:AAA15 family ATPase/GTPase
MENIFITNIHIEKVRHLKNINIQLSQTEKKHLILTGQNGSGKTSLLERFTEIFLAAYLEGYVNGNLNLEKFVYDFYTQKFVELRVELNVPFIDRDTLEDFEHHRAVDAARVLAQIFFAMIEQLKSTEKIK